MGNSGTFLLVVTVAFCFASSAKAITGTTIDYPGTSYTYLQGIDGDNIVGFYNPTPGGHESGFLYDGSTFTPLDYPGANYTHILGIDGRNLVGYAAGYGGVLYNLDSRAWTVYFQGGFSAINDIDGSNIVGTYNGLDGIYNLDTHIWTTLEFPGAEDDSGISGIDGGNIVGTYSITSYDHHGFLYNGTWNTLDFPGADKTYITGIDGSYIVGYTENSSFLYNLDSEVWTPLDFAGISATYAYGIDGDNIVGSYIDFYNGVAGSRGFLATIPEPATLLLFGLGAFLLKKSC